MEGIVSLREADRDTSRMEAGMNLLKKKAALAVAMVLLVAGTLQAHSE